MKNKRKELRTSKGVSQNKLSKLLGIAQNTLAYNQPDNLSLIKIAEYFGVSVDFILGRYVQVWDGNKPPNTKKFLINFPFRFQCSPFRSDLASESTATTNITFLNLKTFL